MDSIVRSHIAIFFVEHHGHEPSHVTVKAVPTEKKEAVESHDHHDHGMENNHSIIGVTLVVGFIFMLLVDQIGGSHMHGSTGLYISYW